MFAAVGEGLSDLIRVTSSSRAFSFALSSSKRSELLLSLGAEKRSFRQAQRERKRSREKEQETLDP
jgi:hypothetical protein